MPDRPPPIHIPLFPCGVGSTHHTDADAAVEDILRGYKRMPFWPQLPNRAPEEMMLPQFGLSLPGATWDGETLHWSGPPAEETEAAAALPPPERAAGLHAFLRALPQIPAEQTPPVVKGQMTGPLTLARAMRDSEGRPPHASPEHLLWLAQFLGRMGAAQAQALGAGGAHVVMVFDEPALAYVDEPSLPIPWRTAAAALRAAMEPVQNLGALAGLHCCQPANWTRVLDARPNLIHFDGREGCMEDMLLHKSAIREHVARGGYLGWGLWPTDDPAPVFEPKPMEYYLSQAARDLSFVDASVGLIFKRSILTGACGSAGLTAAQEQRMAADLEALSMGIRRRYWIAATVMDEPRSSLELRPAP